MYVRVFNNALIKESSFMIQNYSQYSDTLKKMEMCTGLGCRGEVKE
jgi:hypothetical protein